MNKTLAILLAALALPLAAVAHHSFAMFDMAKSMNYKGTVKEVQWTNPHVWVELDVTADGKTAHPAASKAPPSPCSSAWAG